jgi:hypothetical protein
MTDLIQPSIADQRYLAYQRLLARQDEIDLTPLLIYRLASVGSDVLPSLAWQLHLQGADGWNLATTDAQRRDLIQNSILLHRTKGTPGGVEQALARVGFPSARVQERVREVEAGPAARHNGQFRRNGYLRRDARQVPRDRSWATFRVTLDAVDYDRARLSLDDIRAVIESYKRAVCWLTDISFRIDVPVEIVTVTDSAAFAIAFGPVDRWWDGPRHDGTLRRSGARRRRHDGQTGRGGSAVRDGRAVSSGPTQHRAAGPYPETLSLALDLSFVDRHTIPSLRDGSLRRDGQVFREGTAPGMRDGGVGLIVLRDGRNALDGGPYPSLTASITSVSAGRWGAPSPSSAALDGGTF